jgi:hypothetical protein
MLGKPCANFSKRKLTHLPRGLLKLLAKIIMCWLPIQSGENKAFESPGTCCSTLVFNGQNKAVTNGNPFLYRNCMALQDA